jgi:stage II sporulation protein R
MIRQKIGVLLLLSSLVVLVFLGLTGQTKKAYTTDNLIRLHVIANSDSEQDQTVKYRVRDRIVELLKEQLTGVKNYQEAREIVIKNRTQLAAAAEEVAVDAGFSYPVEVEIGRFDFPPRAYGKLVLPQGEYEAVRVVLGEGQGANWWCVLFPPLCFVDISGTAVDYKDTVVVKEVLAQQEEALADASVDNRVNLKFKLLEWLNRDDGYLAKLKGIK